MENQKRLLNYLNYIKTSYLSYHWWNRLIKRKYYKYFIKYNGTYVMEEDWDNLIILDACRYDIFKELNIISGKLEYRFSKGSSTIDFLKENFEGKKYYDTIYITANPQIDYHVGNSFLKIIQVWNEGWDCKYKTVLPKTMLEYAIKTEKKYPNKRLIIHFIQPHYPFIGEKARDKIGSHMGIEGGENALKDIEKNFKYGAPKQFIWRLIREGKIDIDIAWEAYKENLEITLPYVKKLVDILKGKTIISSDHGNLFGERTPPTFSREYGHPPGIYVENLVKVPWLIVESNNRKKIVEEKKNSLSISEQKMIQTLTKHLKNVR